MTVNVRPAFPHAGRPDNPYTAGPAVHTYSAIRGRREESQKILTALRGASQDNIPLLYGSRRIGKTTLLYRMSLDPEVRRYYQPVLCDLEGIVHENDTASRFIARLCGRIHKQVSGTKLGRVPPPAVDDTADPLDTFQDYVDRLVSACNDRSLLLMLDEFDLFFENVRQAGDSGLGVRFAENLVQLLRHNMQHNRRVSFILAGTTRLLSLTGAIGERLFQLPIPFEVGELRMDDAITLVEEPARGVFAFSTTARDELLRLTMRHPYLIQAVCHEIFSFMIDNRLSIVSRSELRRVIEERVFLQPTYFQFQTAPLKYTAERRMVALSLAELLQEERRTDAAAVAARMALRGYDLPSSAVQVTLEDLVGEGILMSERSAFRFKFPIVGEYFVTREVSE